MDVLWRSIVSAFSAQSIVENLVASTVLAGATWFLQTLQKEWKLDRNRTVAFFAVFILSGTVVLTLARPHYPEQERRSGLLLSVMNPTVMLMPDSTNSVVLVMVNVINSGPPTIAHSWKARIKLPSGDEYESLVVQPLVGAPPDEGKQKFELPIDRHLPTLLSENCLETGSAKLGWVMFLFPTLPPDYLHTPKSELHIECIDAFMNKSLGGFLYSLGMINAVNEEKLKEAFRMPK